MYIYIHTLACIVIAYSVRVTKRFDGHYARELTKKRIIIKKKKSFV